MRHYENMWGMLSEAAAMMGMLFAGTAIGFCLGTARLEKEAIDHGAAELVVTYKGTQLKWLTPIKVEEIDDDK